MRKIPQRTTSGTRVFNIQNGSDTLTLTFSSHALNALKVDIGTAFVSVARAGTEVGGILEGAIRKNGSTWEMTVRGITPFPIQYEYGLRYRPGSADLQRVRGLLRDGAARGGFVGWYRSNTRAEHAPDEADRKVTEDLFNGPSALFICEASAEGRIAVNCFMILPERTETVFSFDLGYFSLMAESKPREFKVAPVTKIRELYGIMPTGSHKSPALLPPDRGEGKIGRNLAIGAAALSIAGLGFFLRHRAPDAATSIAGSGSTHSAVRSAARSDTALGLTAEYQGNALFISWDRHAVPVASARYAIFTIADGVRTRVLHLNLHDLQTGSILYKPTSDEISLELDVMSNALEPASESIKIMGAGSSNTAAFAPARTAAPAFKELVSEDGKHSRGGVEKAQASISGSLPPQLTPSGSHQRLSDAKQHVPETMKITGIPNAAGTPTAPAAANKEVEANRPSGMHQSESLAEPTSVFAPPPSPRDEPHVGTIEDPNLSNRSSALVHPVLPLGNTVLPSPAAPEVAADAGAPSPALSKTAAQSAQAPVREFRAAIPIRSPQPAMPGGRAIPDYGLKNPIEVQVEVTISAAGRVTHANLVSEAGPYAAMLGPSALDAAWRWTFQPATLGGKPVESRIIVRFRYSHKN